MYGDNGDQEVGMGLKGGLLSYSVLSANISVAQSLLLHSLTSGPLSKYAFHSPSTALLIVSLSM